MELIKFKLDKISKIWNHYFWNYKVLQKKINFNDEVKTNYYGDILAYFNDTFNLLYTNESSQFDKNIFHYTGLLQIIYVQQDLMDELLFIFKLQAASLSDKNPNREIRNELIGHPIRRHKKGNELISSVIFSNKTSNDTLEYIVYSKSNNFKMKVVTYDTQTILNNHKAFLNKYFDAILNKICVHLNFYEKKLSEFEKSLGNNIAFEKVFRQTEILFEDILKFNHLYSKEYLLECYRRKQEHVRYKFVIDMFLKELLSHINETRNDISEFIKEKDLGPKKYKSIPIQEIYFDSVISTKQKKIKKTDYTYELGKLHEKHPIFTIDYFQDIFKTNKKIMAELDNMNSNFYNNLEYYSSYEYLRKLILKKKADY